MCKVIQLHIVAFLKVVEISPPFTQTKKSTLKFAKFSQVCSLKLIIKKSMNEVFQL